MPGGMFSVIDRLCVQAISAPMLILLPEDLSSATCLASTSGIGILVC